MHILPKTFFLLLYIVEISIAIRYECVHSNTSCGCGHVNVELTSTQNHNGQNAVEHSWPMIVLLEYHPLIENPPFCTGSILNNYFILTAAHCVQDIPPFLITIRAGIHSPTDENAITRVVENSYLYPNYIGHTDGHANDIALLELSEPLDFNNNSYITPTCIPSTNVSQYPQSGRRLAVIGWESIRKGEEGISQTLRQGEIFAIDNNNPMCLRSLINSEKQFCAGLLIDGRDPCYGDYGGPILQWIDNRWEQVGITSFSRCGVPGYPSIYTRVAFYTNWINSIIQTHNESLYTTTTPNPPVTYSCDRAQVPCGCGYRPVRFPSTRIIGGENAIPNSWSMVVSIRIKLLDEDTDKHICGGTILNEWYILTAAHCVDDDALNIDSNITISIGLHNQSEINHTIRKCDRIIIHPLWKQGELFSNDIALIRLSEALDFETNPFISRTCRPPPMNSKESIINYPLNGTALIAIGWGQTDYSTSPEILQQVNLYSIHHNDSICARVIFDSEVQLCAGVYNDRKGVCFGDSGGPILQWIGDRWEQVGISSYVTHGCAIRGYPPVFTRLAAFHDWIEWNMNPDNYTTSTPPTTTTTVTTTETTRETSATLTLNTTTGSPPVSYECDRERVSCGCGMLDASFISSRIIGGTYAKLLSWTMIASIRLNDTNEHLCAGTIVSDRYILTAAHCVQNQSFWKLMVIPGHHRLSAEARYIHQIDRIHQHPDYRNRGKSFENDIALLHLTTPIGIDSPRFNTLTCIPRIISPRNISKYPSNKARLAIIGWGMTNKNQSSMSDRLEQAEIFVIDNKNSLCSNLTIDSDIQFCTEHKQDGIAFCPGDSGGPLLQWMDGYWDQVGIISASRCDIDGQASVHTRLAYYYDWMASILDYDNQTISTETKLNFTSVPIIYHCNQKNVTCGCGYSNVELTSSRIIGGEDVIEASWTMFVSLRILNSTKHICGGTLLSNSYVLTAAHCVKSFSYIEPFDLTIVAGITNRVDSDGYIRMIRRIYIHPNFTNQDNRFVNDIAILELDYPLLINLNPVLSKTCIPHMNSSMLNKPYTINGTQFIVIGWGTTKHEEYNEPDILQQTEVFAMDSNHPICSKFISDINKQFCAETYREQRGPCQGDSGGAILHWTGRYWDQIGIISSNFACENGSVPDIYTRLSYYRSWMNEIVGKTGEQVEPALSIIPINTTSASTIRSTTSKNFALKHQLNSTLFNIFMWLVIISLLQEFHI